MAEVGLRWWRRVVPQKPKEISMHKPNSKRRTPSHSSSSKTAKQANAAAQTITHKPIKPKRAQPAVGQQHRPSAKQTKRAETKQARILAMLRAPSGATVDGMMHATGWQQHSVRGFLAGVVRKKLGLNLVSAATEGGRFYWITDRTASDAA
jgi:Protein of unknown function (DUF3489)